MKKEKIIIAPNAFKGALSAAKAASAIKKGLASAGSKAEIIEIPIADGGDGSLEVIAKYLDLKIQRSKVSGPLGQEIMANWGLNRSKKLAVIELAEASGLKLLSRESLDPLHTSTYGTGELILEALKAGVNEIYLTVGGSATVDLGAGILECLGVKFYKEDGQLRNLCPEYFKEIVSIDLKPVKPILLQAKVRILSDVTNPLLGKEGAAAVFGPQKGADPHMVDQLEAGLDHLASLLELASQKSIRNLDGGGAAGGVSAGLHAVLDAEIIDGAGQMLRWANFEEHLKEATLLITGEGRIDTQTNYGKGPGLVARKAKEKGIKVIGLSGILDEDVSNIKNFDQLIQISDPNDSLEDSMRKTGTNLEKAAAELLTPRPTKS